MHEVQKPINRSYFRQLLGKEYYILKRKWNWIKGSENWARPSSEAFSGHSVFKHRSMILRPLKNVDMYLQENKRTNLRLAIKKINGTVIKPGETFSLWKLVGRPTRLKGYKEGLILQQGQIKKGTGGGLCQLGNLLYWIFAHSPLEITERYRHSYDVFPDVNRKVPFGAGATLAYNYIDLQVKNNADFEFKINLWLDETHLNGELLSSKKLNESYRIEERNHLMKLQSWGGYTRHNQIFKITSTKNGRETEEILTTNHAIMMYNPFLTE